MLDPQEYERLKTLYRSLADEKLLDLVRNQARDFPPEALFLIRGELTSRGYREENFAPPDKESGGFQAEAQETRAVPVSACASEFVAGQVTQLLSQNGIPSAIIGREIPHSAIVGERPWVGASLTIVVAEHDARRAKDILASFPPLNEGMIVLDDASDESGGENSDEGS